MWPITRCGFSPRVAVSLWAVVLLTSPAYAIWPTNQTLDAVPYPIVNGDNQKGQKMSLNAVVEVTRPSQGLGTGSVIGKNVSPDGKVGYFCILTADHVRRASARQIGLSNGNPASLPQFTYRLKSYIQIPPDKAAGDKAVDMDVMLAFGINPKSAAYTGTGTLSIANATAAQNTTFSEIGFGNTGFLMNNKLNQLPNTYGTKRYQNNSTDLAIPNFKQDPGYLFHAISYKFAAANGFGFGFGLQGDSGAPLLDAGAQFNPGMGLPNVQRTNEIIGIDVYGPTRNIAAGDLEYAVDAGFYQAQISQACQDLFNGKGTLLPEPGALTHLALAAGVLVILYYVRRRRVAAA
jgi:hypothetical protein